MTGVVLLRISGVPQLGQDQVAFLPNPHPALQQGPGQGTPALPMLHPTESPPLHLLSQDQDRVPHPIPPQSPTRTRTGYPPPGQKMPWTGYGKSSIPLAFSCRRTFVYRTNVFTTRISIYSLLPLLLLTVDFCRLHKRNLLKFLIFQSIHDKTGDS